MIRQSKDSTYTNRTNRMGRLTSCTSSGLATKAEAHKRRQDRRKMCDYQWKTKKIMRSWMSQVG